MFIPKRVIFEKGSLDTEVGKNIYNKIKDTSLYDKLIEVIDESEKWVINNPQLAAEKCEELGITVNKNVINESIKIVI